MTVGIKPPCQVYFGFVCPSADCPMCSGEACALCGAGCSNTDPDRPKCAHDVIERHTEGRY